MSLRGYMAVGMLSAVLLPWIAYFALAPAGEIVRLAVAASLVVGLLGFVAAQIGRHVIRPLAAMGQEAYAIATGDIGDSVLPPSNVHEVATVRAAFNGMRQGLAEAFGRQAELEAERRFILNAVAHDFTTPLFVLRGHLEGLSTGLAASPEQRVAYLAVCQRKVQHLHRLVADLRASTQLESLADTLVRDPIDFRVLVRQVAQAFEPAAEDYQICLTTDVPDAPCPILGDKDWLERGLSNIISNALRHTPVTGAISLALANDDDRAILHIDDTGDGIDPNAMPHIFKPFYRGNAARTSGDGGLGMGLAIAQRVFQVHGGDLEACNRASGGARFTLWIPLHSSILENAPRPS